MAYQSRGRPAWRNDFRDRQQTAGGFAGAQELASKSLFIQSKKFYVDVKQNRRGKFVKISEVAMTGQKMRLVLDMPTAKEFHERLTEFCEYYTTLGPAKWDRSRMGVDEGKLKAEVIFREDRRYYMDLKENHRGRFLKVSMTLPNFDRSMIVIPAQGMIDIRDALTDILHEFGQDDKPASVSAASASTVTPEDLSGSGDCGSLEFDGKTFSFQVGENPRGTYVRISEVSPNFRTAITIPCQSWKKFVDMVEKATVEGKASVKPMTVNSDL